MGGTFAAIPIKINGGYTRCGDSLMRENDYHSIWMSVALHDCESNRIEEKARTCQNLLFSYRSSSRDLENGTGARTHVRISHIILHILVLLLALWLMLYSSDVFTNKSNECDSSF